MPKDPNEVGALWSKQGRKGEYLTGTITGIGAVVCFRNESATVANKQPFWRILKSQPTEDREARAPEGLPSDRQRANDRLRNRLDEDIPW